MDSLSSLQRVSSSRQLAAIAQFKFTKHIDYKMSEGKSEQTNTVNLNETEFSAIHEFSLIHEKYAGNLFDIRSTSSSFMVSYEEKRNGVFCCCCLGTFLDVISNHFHT